MHIETLSATNGFGYANRPITKAPEWHGYVVWDLLFNNLTTGLFLVAALCELARSHTFAHVARIAYPLALVFLLADLVCLTLDLGDPWRFHHMLRVFKPSSPMSFGTWSLVVYSFPLTVAAALSVFPTGGMEVELIRKAALVLGLAPALACAAYKGVLLSTTAQPGWRDGRWLGGYLTSSAFLLGCATNLAIAASLGEGSAVALLRPALGLFLVLNAITIVLLMVDFRTVVTRLYPSRKFWPAAILLFGGGTLVPFGLVLVTDEAIFLLGAWLLIVLASLAIRYLLIKVPELCR